MIFTRKFFVSEIGIKIFSIFKTINDIRYCFFFFCCYSRDISDDTLLRANPSQNENKLSPVRIFDSNNISADRLAQLVERRTTAREVSGSSPRPDQHSGS